MEAASPVLAHAFASLRAQAQAEAARLRLDDAVQALLLAFIIRLCTQLEALACRHAAAARAGQGPESAEPAEAVAAARRAVWRDWWVHGRPAPGMRPHPAPEWRPQMRRVPRPVRGPPSAAAPSRPVVPATPSAA